MLSLYAALGFLALVMVGLIALVIAKTVGGRKQDGDEGDG